MRYFRTNIQEQRLQVLESFIATANHHGELALLQGDDAAGDWGVDHVGALLADFRSQRAAHFGAHRAHVNVELASVNTSEQSLRSIRHRRERGGVRHHGERHIRRGRDGPGSCLLYTSAPAGWRHLWYGGLGRMH